MSATNDLLNVTEVRGSNLEKVDFCEQLDPKEHLRQNIAI